MSKSIKQIYVSIELGENDLKLLVAEYYNTRFNILKVERATTSAISDFKVINKKQLSSDINELVTNASNSLGANIEKVILVLPAYNFKRVSLKSKVIPESGYVSKNDIARAISNSLSSQVDNDVITVNSFISKYYINGLSTRRMPEKEACNELIVDIDLLCADRNMIIDYISCVESAGIKVLDIVMNTYAIAKEASLIEESLKDNIILLNIDRPCTYLTLMCDGRFVTSDIIFEGINNIVNDVLKKYPIAKEDAIKLVKYDVDYYKDNLDDVVYAYNDSNSTRSITRQEINDACALNIDNLVDKLITMCKPIIEKGAILFVTGEGLQINSLVNSIKNRCDCIVKTYYPDTIGARDPSLSAIYGSLFVYRDKVLLNNLNVNCIDLLQYESIIDQKELDSEGETITTKIKNLFKQYVEREGK